MKRLLILLLPLMAVQYVAIASNLPPGTAVDRQVGMPAPVLLVRTGKKYVCPNDADVVADKPGKCPKCGGKLKQVVTTADRSKRPF